MESFKLINFVEKLITTGMLSEQSSNNEQKNRQIALLNEKMENQELKNLLSQTSEMNAVISAG